MWDTIDVHGSGQGKFGTVARMARCIRSVSASAAMKGQNSEISFYVASLPYVVGDQHAYKSWRTSRSDSGIAAPGFSKGTRQLFFGCIRRNYIGANLMHINVSLQHAS